MDEKVKNNQLSDEQLESVGGGNGVDEVYKKPFRNKLLKLNQREELVDELSAVEIKEVSLGSNNRSGMTMEDIKKMRGEAIYLPNNTPTKSIK